MFTLVPYERRRSLLNDWFGEFDRLFDTNFLPSRTSCRSGSCGDAKWAPAVDVREEDDRYVVKADIPGVDPKDIEVTLENGVLTVSGERTEEKKESEKGFNRVERVSGSFRRSFSLPEDADGENISAAGKNGVLEIAIPKAEQKKPKKIKVH